ncbi:hypothetical protein ASG51_14840 [Methylobacterium sp. Leaf465]|nr:hypothetical protein ASG51_14840 [Methylobacterium sp. Leaf465]
MLGIETERVVHLGLGGGDRCRLDDLTFAIKPIEFRRNPYSLGRVGRGEEGCPESRIPDASPGIDARADKVAEVPGLWRLSQRRSIQKRCETNAAAGAHHLKALHDEGAIQANQRDDIRDGGQANEVERLGEVRQPIDEFRFSPKAPV